MHDVTASSIRGARIGVLMSGGLDSGVLVHRLLSRAGGLTPIYVRCGLRWENAEVYWLRRLLQVLRSPRLKPLRVVDLPLGSVYGTHWSLTGRRVPSARSADSAVYLPGRNVLLLSAAAIVCTRQHISILATGLLKGNPFGDASPQFLRRFAACLTQALHQPIRILTPLRRFNKAQLVSTADTVPLELTFSCLRPDGRFHCGRCNKCAERMRAFRNAGVPDPTTYAY